MARAPCLLGLGRSRWTLALLRDHVPWLAGRSRGGISRLVRRLGLRYRRGRAHLHSPDPDYPAKLAAVAAAGAAAAADPGRVVLLYQDELTYYRRPSLDRAWSARGGPGPPAEQGHGVNTKRRVVGCLDVRDGRLFAWQRERADVATLVRYYKALGEAYPQAEVIYVAQDNWPVHFHPAVAAAAAQARVRLLRLPTYAPWTNPIEKVWRRLKQEVLHMHPYADGWETLKAAVTAWLERWAGPSPELLRYVGLGTG